MLSGWVSSGFYLHIQLFAKLKSIDGITFCLGNHFCLHACNNTIGFLFIQRLYMQFLQIKLLNPTFNLQYPFLFINFYYPALRKL
jgi:hypothetical protein